MRRSLRRRAYEIVFRPRVAARDKRLLSHQSGRADVYLAVAEAAPGPNRTQIATRLIAAYRRAERDRPTVDFPHPSADLWTHIVATELGELTSIIESGNAARLSDYLMDFSLPWGGLSFSMDGLTISSDPRTVALTYLDKLVCLAEAMGVLPCENPEQGRSENLECDLDQTLAGIEHAFRAPIAPPAGIVRCVGLPTSKGVFHYRHLNALYTSWRMSQLAEGPVCEYGGGLGIVAFYARRLGLVDYTLLDLPIVNVFAGHFLMSAIGPEHVSLYGEPPGDLKVLPYWSETGPQSLAVNQDSFPEIEERIVRRYLQDIARTSRRLLTINHESQPVSGPHRHLNVSRMLEGDPRYKRVYRARYWLREGYVEELYDVARAV
jgi:hypothetical protein